MLLLQDEMDSALDSIARWLDLHRFKREPCMTSLDEGKCIVDTLLGDLQDKSAQQNHMHVSLNNLMFIQFVWHMSETKSHPNLLHLLTSLSSNHLPSRLQFCSYSRTTLICHVSVQVMHFLILIYANTRICGITHQIQDSI